MDSDSVDNTGGSATPTHLPTQIAELGAPFAIGRTAEVYRLPDDKVLKLALPEFPKAELLAELQNTQEAVSSGVTPIAAHELIEVEGRPGLVFDALDGQSLNSFAERNLLRLREAGRVLAREHFRVHQVETGAHREVRDVALELLDRPVFETLGDDGRRRVADRVTALPDGNRLLHMDFHTQSVFRHRDSWVVIDWQTSLHGCPAADVASTLLLLRDAELWPGTPKLKQVLYDIVRRQLAAAYLSEYLKLSGLDHAEIDAWRLVALVLRLGIWDIASERQRMRDEIVSLIEP